MKNSDTQTDEKLLMALAMAMVEKPRANLQELARAVGVSKATLYRFCRTRNELVERLMTHSSNALTEAIENNVSDDLVRIEALHSLVAQILNNREYVLFLIYYCQLDSPEMSELETRWSAVLDAFFLKGQQAGIFRIDFVAAALSELLMSIIIGFIDAERRGRVARANLASLIVTAFLEGAKT